MLGFENKHVICSVSLPTYANGAWDLPRVRSHQSFRTFSSNRDEKDQ
jgi:hypothetical protein